jgi:hypothetical protein
VSECPPGDPSSLVDCGPSHLDIDADGQAAGDRDEHELAGVADTELQRL